jgi:twitching motility protein PilT
MFRVSINVNTDEAQGHPTSIGEGDSAPGTVNKRTDNADEYNPDLLLGRMAIHYEVLSRDQVEKALSAWQPVADSQDFGAFLIAKSYLDSETLGELVRVRDLYLQQKRKKQAPVTQPHNSKLALVPEPRAMNGQKPKPSRKPVEFKESVAKPEAASETAAEPHVQADKPDLLSFGPGVTLQNLLQQTIELNASDLHLHSGATLRIRLDGVIRDATSLELTSDECDSLIKDVLNERQRKRLEENFQVDFAYEIPGVGRFRANVYQQRRGIDAVFRTIKPTPPTLGELGLPQELKQYTDFHQGLVLFTGPAGCGKSSTMAAMVNLVNKNRADHILTIEDPIEYVHNSASCSVNQREAGVHTESFSKALRAALREDPDVIVIGELRDRETISLALTAAETGHLVMGTLHTSSAIRTVNRLLGVFPPDQQGQVRMMLSEALKVVISQRLIQRADGRGRVAALEVMVNNQAIGNLIRENRTFQIKSIMQTGVAHGQQLLDRSLAKLLKKRVITKEEAVKYAEEPDNFT